MKKFFLTGLGVLFLLGMTLVFLVYNGFYWPFTPSKEIYPVRGVDVSSYQGEIDWQKLREQGIDFAFIKATEGSSHTDTTFHQNWANALEEDILIGAYHFFSFDSPGKTQGEHFVATVPKGAGILPPVVDVEFYGEKEKNPPGYEEVKTSLKDMLHILEAHYGVKPILYTTRKAYDLYLFQGYEEYPLWMRSLFFTPKEEWTFWQYANRGRLEGYQGKEKFIDVNVYKGTLNELKAMAVASTK